MFTVEQLCVTRKNCRNVEHGRDLCAAAKVLPARTTCSRYGPCALAARLRGPKIHSKHEENGLEDADKPCTAWLTHLLRPSTIRGLQSSINSEGARSEVIQSVRSVGGA